MIPVVNSIHPSGSASPTATSLPIVKLKRKRKRTSVEQLAVLEGVFRTNQHPNLTLRNQLAMQLLMTPRGVQKWFQNRRAKARSQMAMAASGSSSISTAASVSSVLEGLNAAKALANTTASPTTTSAAVTSSATAALSKHHNKKRAENFRWSEWSQQPNAAGPSDSNPNIAPKQSPFDGVTPAQLLGLQTPINLEELYRFNAAIANHQIAVASQYAAANNNNNNNSGNALLSGLNNYLLSGFSNANAGASMQQIDMAAAAAINSILPSPLQNALLAAGVSNPGLLGQNFPSLVAPVAMKMNSPATSQLSTSPQQQLAASLSALSTSPLSTSPKPSSSIPIPSSQNLTVPQTQPLSLSPRMQPLPSQSSQNQLAPQGLMLLSGLAGMLSEQGATSASTLSSAFSSRLSSPQAPSIKELLFAACTQSNEKRVLELIEQGVDVNCRDSGENSPLIIAAGFGFPEVAAVLIKNKADVNAQNKMGITAVYMAAKFGHQATLACLLEAGANPNTPELQYQETPLHAATFKGFIQIMKLLLQYNANVNAKDSKGKTPLHYHQGLTRVIKLLASKEANVQATDTEGYTPLHYAVRDGQVNAALCLLEQGASIEERTKDGLTPIQLACLYSSNTEMFDVLLEHDANPKAKSIDGRTCLHYAVEKGNLGIITTLLQKDGNCLEEKDVNGTTPLFLAERHSNANVLKHIQKCTSRPLQLSTTAGLAAPRAQSPSPPTSPTSTSLTIAEEEDSFETDDDEESEDTSEEDEEYKETKRR